MVWHRWNLCAAMLIAWVALAAWQIHEYQHERQRARETLQHQAESLSTALIGGVRSHRRVGRFFEAQLRDSLGEMAQPAEILAVAIADHQGRVLVSGGDENLLPQLPTEAGFSWQEDGLHCVTGFNLTPDAGGGPGMGNEAGWGRGRGRGEFQASTGPFAGGGEFLAGLVIDRTATDRQIRSAAWLRGWVVVAGTIAMVCLCLVAMAVYRLVQARSRQQVLEAEARHLRELSQAAAGLAHETRNPLGLLRGWTQRLARSELSSGEARRQAEAIVEECDRVTARINQFLAFARPAQPSPGRVELEPMMAELTGLLEPDLTPKKLQMAFRPSPHVAAIEADSELLRQAIFNLMQNAVQFSPEGGEVEISVTPGHDRHVRLEVADRGPGVPADAVDSLFTPYFTTRPDGTGLGLAIVRRIATAHGWRAGYTPRDGGGSLFWLEGIHD